jgi:pimeloyl-ACP methyl ester carboxylesterase
MVLTQFGGYPAFEVMYDTGGQLVAPSAEDEAVNYFGTGAGKGITDIFVISHGWNNDIDEARTLYGNVFDSVKSVTASSPLPGRSFGVVALFWPSKKFADPSEIPGGAAGLADPGATRLSAQLDRFAEIFADDPAAAGKIAYARSLIPALEFSESVQDKYVEALTSLVPQPRYERDEGLDSARENLATTPGHEVLARLSAPIAPVDPAPTPGTGGAAGLGGFFGGIINAAANLGDLLTYYTMKDRAGIVGRTGAAATVQRLRGSRAVNPPAVHLIGHSFGGRLVTAAANALPPDAVVQSMSLLEAAYSHNGLAKNWDGAGNDGAFRGVIEGKKVAGPIVITHSSHDFPVGVAYPLASRLANEAAAAIFGGPDDKFGGMGRNGAQHTPEADDDCDLADVGTPYPPFAPNRWVRNIRGDGPPPKPTITSHGDVAKPEIAWAIVDHIR